MGSVTLKYHLIFQDAQVLSTFEFFKVNGSIMHQQATIDIYAENIMGSLNHSFILKLNVSSSEHSSGILKHKA